jgi:hypothetical protein
MNDQKARELVKACIGATDRRNIGWRVNAARDGYLTDVNGVSFELTKLQNNVLERPIYVLELRDIGGQVIDQVRESGEQAGLLGAMQTAGEAARNIGLGTLYKAVDEAGDGAIDNLIAFLAPKGIPRQ